MKEAVFGEINWSEEQFSEAFGVNQEPGNPGWPTIRYFNKGTGYGGKGYKQKEPELDLDAELGNEEHMRNYVTEKSGVSPCDVVWGTDCSVMELKYIGKWIGPDVARSKSKVQENKAQWEQQLEGNLPLKNFAQNTQRVTVLGRILDNFDNPNL